MEDPRCNTRNQVDYTVTELMFLTISAVVSGMDEWQQIHEFGLYRLDWLRKYFPFEYGSPHPSTLSRFFAKLDSEAFGRYFAEWTEGLAQLTGGQVVAIDGKTMRGSADPSDKKAALHMVSAFVSHQSICLGQVATDEKSNEITAIPQLLDLLALEGCTVTIDAMGCQRDIAQKILKKKADYILQIKGNQQELSEQVESCFGCTKTASNDTMHDVGHGRVETRKCEVIENLSFLDCAKEWPGIKSIIRIKAQRVYKKNGTVQESTRYYISSKKTTAKRFNSDIRSHWAIENTLHWSLDVNFREDSSKKRKGNSAANMGLFAKMAINLIKQNPDKKAKSIKGRRLKALMQHQYREQVLAS